MDDPTTCCDEVLVARDLSIFLPPCQLMTVRKGNTTDEKAIRITSDPNSRPGIIVSLATGNASLVISNVYAFLLRQAKLLDDREMFLAFCQENQYQFDTRRRAMHSTAMVRSSGGYEHEHTRQ